MTNKLRCKICGYIHEGDAPPESCPICDAPQNEFEWIGQNEPRKINKADEVNQPLNTLDNEAMQVIIIGSGIAAISCAEEIRLHSSRANVTILTQDTVLPYYRLNLTRFLSGEVKESDLVMKDWQWYVDQDINIRLDRKVSEIDRYSKQVICKDVGETYHYDQLILAMGSHPFVPPFGNSGLKGVYTLRTIEDAQAIVSTIEAQNKKSKIVVIGGGVLGIEAAAALAKSGSSVQILEGSSWLMPRQLNETAGKKLERYLEDSGVSLIKKGKTDKLIGVDTLEGIQLSDGRVIQADIAIIATGVRPNTYLARKAGLNVLQGIVVDDWLKTSDAKIFAIGDCSETQGNLYGLWQPALFQGKIAALNLLGHETRFGGLPRSNRLKIMGIDVFSIGVITPEDGSWDVIEKETEDAYIGLFIRDQQLKGAIVMGAPSLEMVVKSGVENRQFFQLEALQSYDQLIQVLKDQSL